VTNIDLQFAAPFARITLNQPQRKNAMSQAMWVDLGRAVNAINDRPDIRVVTIRGADEAFCAGADISEFGNVYATPEAAQHSSAVIAETLAAVEALRMPSISVIQGPCMGGGCALAMACDLQIADSTARFGVNPTALGTAYSYTDSARLVARVGITRAKLMLLGARVVAASTALDWKLTGDIASRSPTALGISKEILSGVEHDAELSTTKREELHAAFQGCFGSADFAEGTRAFLRKERPQF